MKISIIEWVGIGLGVLMIIGAFVRIHQKKKKTGISEENQIKKEGKHYEKK